MTDRVSYRGMLRSALAAGLVMFSVVGAQAADDDTLPRSAAAAANDARIWRVNFAAADTGATQDAAQPRPDGFFQRIEITGFVDGYYGWNTNRVGPAALRNFDVNHNEFSLNMAEVALEKKATDDSRGGFRVDFLAGQAVDTINSFEPGGPDFMKFVEQAYVSYLAPIGNGLSVDFGKFVTPHGAEVIETRDNYNYSRGLLFSLAIPYYHAGLRASYPATETVTLTGYLVNGWNNVRENNSGKTVGGSIAYKPSDRFSFTQSYMVGPEQQDNNDDFRHLLDTLVSYQLNDRVTLLGNFDYGRDTIVGEAVDWYGFAAYARYQGTERWAVTPRYEWFKDSDGFATGVPQDVQEVTITSEHRLAGGFITRFEWRTDFSNQEYFVNDQGAAKKNQSTFTVGVMYAFSSKE